MSGCRFKSRSTCSSRDSSLLSRGWKDSRKKGRKRQCSRRMKLRTRLNKMILRCPRLRRNNSEGRQGGRPDLHQGSSQRRTHKIKWSRLRVLHNQSSSRSQRENLMFPNSWTSSTRMNQFNLRSLWVRHLREKSTPKNSSINLIELINI